MFKTPKSEIEIEMEKLLKSSRDIINDSHLTTKEARKILDMGCKLLTAFERIRQSRDKWRNRFTCNVQIANNKEGGE